jgi:hypothetical protein
MPKQISNALKRSGTIICFSHLCAKRVNSFLATWFDMFNVNNVRNPGVAETTHSRIIFVQTRAKLSTLPAQNVPPVFLQLIILYSQGSSFTEILRGSRLKKLTAWKLGPYL